MWDDPHGMDPHVLVVGTCGTGHQAGQVAGTGVHTHTHTVPLESWTRWWPGPVPAQHRVHGTPWYCQWHPQCAQHLYTHHTCVSTVWSSVILSDNTKNIFTVNISIIKWTLSVIPSSITASSWRCIERDLPHLHVSCLQHCLLKFCP